MTTAPVRRPARSGRSGPKAFLAILAAVVGITALLQAGGAGADPVSGSSFRPVDVSRLLTGTDVPAGGRVSVSLPDVPKDATGVALNITASSSSRSAVSACPGGSTTAQCLKSPVLRTNTGEVHASDVVVPLPSGMSGAVTLAATTKTRLYVDLHGYYVRSESLANPADSLYQPLTPAAPPVTLGLGGGESSVIELPGAPTGATAVTVGISSSETSERTYLAACPAAQTLPSCARTSVLNPVAGRDRQNTVTVKIAEDGRLRLYNHIGTTQVRLEVQGYYVPAATNPGAGRLVTAVPDPLASTVIRPASAVTWTFADVPAGATAVSLRLEGRGAWQPTAVVACPGQTSYAGCSGLSVFRATPAMVARNTVTLPLGGASMDQVTLTSSAASVRIESAVLGWVVPPGADVLAGIPAPARPVVVPPPPVETPSAAPTPTPTASSTTSPGPTATPTPSTPSATPPPPPLPPTAAVAPPPPPSPPAPGGRPGPGNTGVPAGTPLTRHDGDLIVTQPGTVVDAMDIRGFVRIQAPDVVIRRSVIRGRPVTGSTALITNSAGHRFTVEDSELAPLEPSPYINGIIGYNFTVRRSNVHHVPDGIHIIGNDVRLESSWLHDNLHLQSDPNFGGTPSHDDGIQIQVGTNIRIIGNSISGAYNAGMQITQDRGAVSDVEFSGNYADGGGCTVNLAEKGRGAFRGLAFRDNVFGRSTRVGNCAIIAPSTTTVVNDRNTYTDGQAVQVAKGA